MLHECSPANNAFAEIIKYDGDVKEPRWMDVERSTTFDFMEWTLYPALTTQ